MNIKGVFKDQTKREREQIIQNEKRKGKREKQKEKKEKKKEKRSAFEAHCRYAFLNTEK